VNTLLDILQKQVKSTVKRAFFHASTESYHHLDYRRLLGMSFQIGNLLQAEIDTPRPVILICASSPFSTLLGFYGAISAGYTPLIFPAPKSLGSIERYKEKMIELISIFGADCNLLCDDTVFNKEQFENIPCKVLGMRLPSSILETPELTSSSLPVIPKMPQSSDIAFFQLSGGSTGSGKIIGITHGNAIDNTLAISSSSECSSKDIGVSWLPLYHDMGLVGAELFSLVNDYPLYLMSPFDFLKKPLRWLKTISDYKCTLSPAPNFSYDYCVSRISENELTGIDLSSWRVAFNGAEPVRLDTLIGFRNKFSSFGFSDTAFLSCYGMSESTLAITFTEPKCPIRVLTLERMPVRMGETITLKTDQTLNDWSAPSEGIHISSVGKPVSDFRVRISNEDNGFWTDELRVGEVVVNGSSISRGYLITYPDTFTAIAPHYTGDVGFMYKGELFILDRIKNIIIRNGENYFAGHLENEVARFLHTTVDNVAIFENNMYANPEIIAVAESSKSDLQLITQTPIQAFKSQSGIGIDRLVIIRRGAIPRTTSGKKKHYLLKQLYQRLELDILFESKSREKATSSSY
jgi:acyl-CoA synthetase (AMP-forming)/AMP-acid ligase II